MATWRYRIYLEMSYLRNYQISIFSIKPAKDLMLIYFSSVALPCSDVQGDKSFMFERNHACLHFYSSADFANNWANFWMLKICSRNKCIWKKANCYALLFRVKHALILLLTSGQTNQFYWPVSQILNVKKITMKTACRCLNFNAKLPGQPIEL